MIQHPRFLGSFLVMGLVAFVLGSVAASAPLSVDIQVSERTRQVVKVVLESSRDEYYVLFRRIAAREVAHPVTLARGSGKTIELIDSELFRHYGFYEVRSFPIQNPGDWDGDGVNDLVEWDGRPAMDPFVGKDSDRDGRMDTEERAEGTNPNVADAPTAEMAGDAPVLAAGFDTAMVIDVTGWIWAWGSNRGGQLGLGMPSFIPPSRIGNTNRPGLMARGGLWLRMDVGKIHSLGIGLDGSLWSWGENQLGELGVRLPKYTNAPMLLDRKSRWLAVAAGDQHSLALRSDGTLWAWGDNDRGQLGDGSFNASKFPKQVGLAGATWKAISVGDFQSYALRTDGTLWSWGANDYGQLGSSVAHGPAAKSNKPSAVMPDWRWKKVSAGYHHALGIRSDGTLYAWGENEAGQIGDGSTTSSAAPVRVGQRTDWVEVAAGGFHSLAITRDGELFSWGNNDHGELGTGKLFFKKEPTPVVGNIVWRAVTAGRRFNVGQDIQGRIWTWGENDMGQLGRDSTPIPGYPGEYSATPGSTNSP